MNISKIDSKSQPNTNLNKSSNNEVNNTTSSSSVVPSAASKKKKATIVEPEEDLSRREKDFITYFGYLNEKLISRNFSINIQSTNKLTINQIILVLVRECLILSFITDDYL